jgi:hypothetical protein
MKILFIVLFSLIVLTASQQTQWTVSTLKEHYDYVLRVRDEKIDQKFSSLELAVLKAEQATEKRFESVNEFRAQLADQGRTFVPRNEYESGQKDQSSIIDELKVRLDRIETMKAGGNVVWAYVIAGVSLLVAFFSAKDKIFRNNNLKT